MSKQSGFQSLGRGDQSDRNEQNNAFEEIDFDRMTKKELKQFDEKYGSYRRLLNGKPITRWWLLNHYSKANAEAYKLQKKMESNPKNGKEKTQYEKNQGFSQYNERNEEESCFDRKLVEDIQIDQSDETIFIDREKTKRIKRPKAYLDCLGFGQRVSIEEVPFVIGRNPDQVQLCILDNRTVGKRHAKITFENGNYYIEDLNSKNGIYLNDDMIPRNRPVLLENRIQIVLGDEEFIFYCEN